MGLDKINNHAGGVSERQTKPGVAMCVDLSATPVYLQNSGVVEGSPVPWLASDFGLVDAIGERDREDSPGCRSSDTTGRPDAKDFKLWDTIKAGLEPAEFLPGKAKKPKPDVVYREAEPALKQLAGQWLQKFVQIQEAKPGELQVPPVLILVCDNVDIAGSAFIEGLRKEKDSLTWRRWQMSRSCWRAKAKGTMRMNRLVSKPSRASKSKPKISYGHGVIFPEYFGNTASLKRTIRIDTDLLAKAEGEDPTQSRKDAGEALRQVVATVGKRGEPGEHVRCVVSVSMLTEGWDANNVTHIMGLRAFRSQLLCEQVVGRGLRRMNYTPDPETGLLTEEYVDVYGIPFSVIPFKGRPVNKPEPDDKPKNHVRAMEERAVLEIRFPVVEGYAFALRRNLINCDKCRAWTGW